MKMRSQTVCYFFAILLVCLIVPLPKAFAAIWYVDGTKSLSGDGASWGNAFVSIQEAISNENVQEDDEVWVIDSTYFISTDIMVNKAIGIYGGFTGSESVRSQRDWSQNQTIIDGQSLVDHCINISADATIDGFTVTGGYSDGGGTEYFGGGLIALNSAPVIANCTFEDNFSQMGGAGLDTWLSSPTITGCVFRRNNSVAGGAIRFRDSTVLISDSLFEDNVAEGKGGGIYAWDTSIIVTDTVFLNNNATPGYGGGFMSNNGDATFENCTFVGNESNGGGAIQTNGETIISQSSFEGNTSSWYGGAIVNSGSSMTISSSVFEGNDARTGGAIYNTVGDLSISNCAIYSNEVTHYAGGVYVDDGSLRISYSTLSDNIAGRDGASITSANTATVEVANSILWGNTSVGGDHEIFDLSGDSSIVVNYSDIDQGEFDGNDGNFQIDPLFSDPANADYSLSQASVCISAGTSENAPEYDLLGLARPQGIGYDIGAFEWYDINPPVVDRVKGGEYKVVVEFSERLDQVSATTINNYSINNNVLIDGVDLDASLLIVTLTTSQQLDGDYTLSVENVADVNYNVISFTSLEYIVDSIAPSVPADLQASVVSDSEIDLTWSPSNDNEGVAGYRVYRDDVHVGTTDTTNFSDTGLAEFTTYQYSVLAFDVSDNKSAVSAVVDATTWSNLDLTPPSVLSVTATETSLTVVFDEALNAASAQTLGNYAITGDVDITAASLGGDNRTVTLQTSSHGEGDYMLTISGVEDLSANTLSMQAIDYSYIPLSTVGLMGYWGFNEGAGSTVLDLSGNGNAGTLHNGPTWTLDGALSFDGVDDYVDMGTSNFDLNDELTVAMWVQVQSDTGSRQAILQKDAFIRPFMIRYEAGVFRTGIRTSGVNYLNSVTSPVLDQWYHLAVTYRDGELAIYIDGELDSTAAVSGSLGVISNATTLGSNPNGSDWFNGRVNDLLIFNRALNGSEVGSLHDGATPPDVDNDGVIDDVDNCMNICNPLQLDADNDTIGDVCDETPGCGGCGTPECEIAEPVCP